MSGKKKVLTPADKDYWDKEFYVDGEGSGDTYEWYIDYDTVAPYVQKSIKAGDKILHIGVGNSVLAEKMLSDKEFPEDLCFENLDISEYIIEKMQERLDAILAKMDTLKPTKKKEKQARKQDEEEIDVTAFLADNYRIFKPEQISYKVADVTNMEEYEDGSIDVVLDKGMLDAVLSHGEVETGDNEIVQQVNREIYRVLKPGGVWLVFSGNGSIITTPYFCGDEDVYWEVQEQQISSVRKTKNKDNRTVYFYKLTALEPDTSGRL